MNCCYRIYYKYYTIGMLGTKVQSIKWIFYFCTVHYALLSEINNECSN